MALSIGSKVEARDFEDEWHGAEIIEVDYEDMEVLIHYNIDKKKVSTIILMNNLLNLEYHASVSNSYIANIGHPAAQVTISLLSICV